MPEGLDGLGFLRKKNHDMSKQHGKVSAAKDSRPRTLLPGEQERASFFMVSAYAAAGTSM